ncbi:MAG: hypothetical protein LBU17_02375 [Treponema sp.]|jgi:hypothetical protein|nr:hypothetical protein [Treponema sp.]
MKRTVLRMGMLTLLLTFGLALAACQEDSPQVVVEKYIAAILKGDVAEAKKYGPGELAPGVDINDENIMQTLQQMFSGAKISDVQLNGNTAIVNWSKETPDSSGSGYFTVVKEGSTWKIKGDE